MAHDVFISYASSDKAVADAVCHALESRRLRCWIAPRDVPPGANFRAAILEAIAQSRVLVLVLSAGANASRFVQAELGAAFDRGLSIVTLRREDVPLAPAVELCIRDSHWLDALTPPLEAHLVRLAEAVAQLLALGTPAAGTAGGRAPTPPSPMSGTAAEDRATPPMTVERRDAAGGEPAPPTMAGPGGRPVYVSYAREDKSAADAVCAALEEAGIRCWLSPRDVPFGAGNLEAIIDTIRDCELMVLVFSPHANASTQKTREVGLATEAGKPIVPVTVAPVDGLSPPMAYHLGGGSFVEASTPPLAQHLPAIVDTVRRVLQIRRGRAPAT
jgi:hypothetical protein